MAEMARAITSLKEKHLGEMEFLLKYGSTEETLYQPNSTRTREEDIMVDRNKLHSVLENSPTSEAAYQVMDALAMKYRGGWPRLMHLSADYARDSGTTTMCPCGLKARYTVQSCCPPSYKEPRPGQFTDDR